MLFAEDKDVASWYAQVVERKIDELEFEPRAAFQRLGDFGREIVAVPKGEALRRTEKTPNHDLSLHTDNRQKPRGEQ